MPIHTKERPMGSSIQDVYNTIHAPYTWVYSDEASRLAAIGFEAYDVYKKALQLNDYSGWILVNHSPPTWIGECSGGILSYTEDILTAAWTPDGPLVYYDVTHNMNTMDYVISLRDSTTEISLTPQKWRALTLNTTRVWVTAAADLSIVMVVVGGSLAGLFAPFTATYTPTASWSRWQVNHNLGRNPLLISCESITGGIMNPCKISYIDVNNLDVYFDPKGAWCPAGTIVCY